ncbi:hypothetical protein AB4298_20815 [Shewanella sp. 10N.261.52.F9]|uniref:hypothetical protein n=1 Tax=Shewanella sp. 10N.261.52.F9 TaxID=3229684 RepID=UPI003551F0DD
MSNLIIPTEKLDSFAAMTKQLNSTKSDYCVSVIISPKDKTITWIGGSSPDYTLITQPLTKGHRFKQAEFALPGDFFSQSIKSVIATNQALSKHNSYALQFKLRSSKGRYIQATHIESALSQPELMQPIYRALRQFATLPIHKNHIEYMEAVKQRALHEVLTTDLKQLSKEAEESTPFEYIQFDDREQEIRIQRAGKITTKPMPENTSFPLPMALNQPVLTQLQRLIKQTDSPTISIAQEGEIVTISTPEETVTSSIAGLIDFYKRVPEKPMVEVALVIDYLSLIAEVRSHQKYREIKKNPEAFMLVHNSELFVTAGLSGNNLCRQIFGQAVKNNEDHLYRFDTKDLIDTGKCRKTNGSQVKLVITQNKKGERFFEFYINSKEALPFAKISIEAESNNIETAIRLKRDYLTETQAENTDIPQTEKQLDLYGFEGM